MTFKELQTKLTDAMKEKNRVKKTVIADMIACAKNMAIEAGCKDNITDEIVAKAILKSKKMCQEQIDTCPKDRENTLIEYKERAKIIAEFAPTMMTEDDIKMELLMFCEFEGLDLTKANRAKIMKGFMPTLKGRADGKLANKIITELLV